MDSSLRHAYERARYRVRRPGGGWDEFLIGRPLPPALVQRLGERPWGFLTAWNPRSVLQPRARNRAAQRALLQALAGFTPALSLHVGFSCGDGGWREPGLLAVGAAAEPLARVARQFDQAAIVLSERGEVPRLYWLSR